MGLFCVNLHFRTSDDNAVSAALKQRGVSRCQVVPAANGWTSLYEEQASQQDDERIRDLARGLSDDLHVAAIAFLVHDSDVACYWLFDNGQLLDEYNSYPDYFDADAEGDEPPRRLAVSQTSSCGTAELASNRANLQPCSPRRPCSPRVRLSGSRRRWGSIVNERLPTTEMLSMATGQMAWMEPTTMAMVTVVARTSCRCGQAWQGN